MESLKYNLNVFQNKYNSNLKKTKFACNVVDDVFFKSSSRKSLFTRPSYNSWGLLLNLLNALNKFANPLISIIAGQLAMNKNEISQDRILEMPNKSFLSTMLLNELQNRRKFDNR